MEKVICGIQQMGIGVSNVDEYWKWYNEYFGFNTKILGDEGVAERMLPYTGGKPQPRYAILVLNLRGGGGLEIWEPRGRELNYIKTEPKLGDYGIFACKIRCQDVNSAYAEFSAKGLNILNKPTLSLSGLLHFFMKDPWNNLFEVVQDSYVFINQKKITGGVCGAIMGVSDMERSIKFYSSIMEYDTVVYDKTEVFEDLSGVAGADVKLRRVLLRRSKPIQGPLCEVLGTSQIELVQMADYEAMANPAKAPVKLYDGRLWGDPGFIHLCFDVRNMEAVRQSTEALGHKFVCDSGKDFGMGEANGHFTYIEDPDGALIEFVETFKIPILKKLGIYLNLENKDDKKPLCRLITKALRFM